MNDGVQTLVSSFSGSRDGAVRSQRRREAVFLGGKEEVGRFLGNGTNWGRTVLLSGDRGETGEVRRRWRDHRRSE